MKYKLIKTYPGSPELGTIEEPVHNNVHMMSNGRYGYDFSKHKEFWEPVVEKDYEILSVITNNNKFIEKVYNQDATIEPYWKIHSVKRLSDGEIFTIGDLVGTPGSTYPLKEFKIIDCENTLAVHYYKDKNGGSGHYNCRLKNLKKVKQPLFTTEDGVDIFEGDKFYSFRKDFSNNIKEHTGCKFSQSSMIDPEWFDFSTKEKAEEYILMNKPCLSLNDIIEEVNSHRDTNNFQTSQMASWLKELVNLKING